LAHTCSRTAGSWYILYIIRQVHGVACTRVLHRKNDPGCVPTYSNLHTRGDPQPKISGLLCGDVYIHAPRNLNQETLATTKAPIHPCMMALPLMDELVEEILLRFPPDDPASLLRAVPVYKSWCRLISSQRFRCSFCEFHRTVAPMLAFFLNVLDNQGVFISRVVPISSSCPPIPDSGGFALDARHGRVLLHTTRPLREDLPFIFEHDMVVWNPITGEHKELPVLHWYRSSRAWNAAVLCHTCADGHDHLACHDDGPFLIVFVGTIMGCALVLVYLSETGMWSSSPTHSLIGHPPFACHIPMVGSGLLVEDTIHFAIDGGCRILSYDIANRSLTVRTMPWIYHDGAGNMGLMAAEDGGLGVAGVVGYGLYRWSSFLCPNGVWAWRQGRTIELDMMLSIDIGVPSTSFRFVGFAEGADTVLLSGSDGIHAVTLESGQVRNVYGRGHFFRIVPYVTIYIPGTSYSCVHLYISSASSQ
jgi:hypothetical protein